MKNPLRFATLITAFLISVAAVHAKPRLGIESYTCRNMNFEDVVLFAESHGIKEVELTRVHLSANDPVEVNLAKKAFLEAHGVTAYSMGVCATSMDKEENRKLFELAKLFGMKVIVVEPQDPAQWDNLEELVREYDIKLAMHNHGTGTVHGNPAVVKQILATRDKRIGVCLDIGWATAAGWDAAVVFENYRGRVYDMHLKDKRLDMVDDRGRAQDTFIGLGNTNYAGLIAAMKRADWSGVMAIETDSAEFAKDPSAFVDAAKRFFDESFGN